MARNCGGISAARCWSRPCYLVSGGGAPLEVLAPTSKTKPEWTTVRSPRFTALQAHALAVRTAQQLG